MGSGFKNIFAAAIVASTMVSCLPEPLEVHDIPALEQKIVVSSQITPGQTVAVLLTKSMGALDASGSSDPLELLNRIMIDDAAVRIEGGGESFALTHFRNGVYVSDTIALTIGESYTLYVDSPSAGSVTATSIVTALIPFEEVTAEMFVSGRDTLANITYKFTDEPGKNWYMLNGQHVRQNYMEQILNPRITTRLLDDATFEGQEKSDSFRILFDEVEPGDTIAVVLSNINKDYYDFMQLRLDTRWGFVEALGEPVNYPSNVNGGLGFFNLYIPDIRVFILEE